MRGMAQRQHGNAQFQNFRVEHARGALGFAAEHNAARRGLRNLGKHWAMTIACIASLSVCMTLNTFATLAEVNVDSMVNYLGQQNEMVVYVDPEADDATIQSVGERITATPGVSRVQYMSKEDVLNQYRGYMADYAVLLDEFENDNPFKANYRVSLADLSQMQAMSQNFQSIPGVYSAVSYTHLTLPTTS